MASICSQKGSCTVSQVYLKGKTFCVILRLSKLKHSDSFWLKTFSQTCCFAHRWKTTCSFFIWKMTSTTPWHNVSIKTLKTWPGNHRWRQKNGANVAQHCSSRHFETHHPVFSLNLYVDVYIVESKYFIFCNLACFVSFIQHNVPQKKISECCWEAICPTFASSVSDSLRKTRFVTSESELVIFGLQSVILNNWSRYVFRNSRHNGKKFFMQ